MEIVLSNKKLLPMKEQISNFVLVLSGMRRIQTHFNSFRIQGERKGLGGTCVVRFDLPKTQYEIAKLLNDLIFGIQREDVRDFINRSREKIVGAYAMGIEISGYDEDGDSLTAELKFKNQGLFENFLENGAFKTLDDQRSHWWNKNDGYGEPLMIDFNSEQYM